MLEQELSLNTKNYIKNTDVAYRKKKGQFFTPHTIIERMFKVLSKKIDMNTVGLKVLEPSCGTGEFIPFILGNTRNPEITAMDIDSIVLDSFNKNGYSVTPICADFLSSLENGDKFDLIVGNPPYFETLDYDKNKFSGITCGRVNIYSLFIKKSIDLLNKGGYLAFVLPVSMNTGKYFSKLREYILETCSIVHIEIFKPDLFEDAQQEVQILILRKKKTKHKSSKYVFSHNGIVVFSKDYLKYRKFYVNTVSIEDLGFKVYTGNVVWNKHKEDLHSFMDSNKYVPLVWSENIKDDGCVLLDKKYS
jgi:adenine-specific DNA-methyltransferase